MTQRRWVVGKLIEILPGQNSGLLGWNKGKGMTIALRLRRKDTGFYHIDQLLAVLCHELAHNVHGPHNAAFDALNQKLREEVEALNRDKGMDWVKGRAKKLGGSGTHGKSTRELMLAGFMKRE